MKIMIFDEELVDRIVNLQIEKCNKSICYRTYNFINEKIFYPIKKKVVYLQRKINEL